MYVTYLIISYCATIDAKDMACSQLQLLSIANKSHVHTNVDTLIMLHSINIQQTYSHCQIIQQLVRYYVLSSDSVITPVSMGILSNNDNDLCYAQHFIVRYA